MTLSDTSQRAPKCVSQNIEVFGAGEHNLKSINVNFPRYKFTILTGVSGSGKSSLAFDTVLAEARRRFFYTLSNYTRQFLDLGSRPKVTKITGLSPAIALAQRETQPSRRATVGTLTDISELLGVLFARHSEKKCPKHGVSTETQTAEEIKELIVESFDSQLCAICLPLVDSKKGRFEKPLEKFAKLGFRAFIDGKIRDLSSIPELDKDKKHVIKIIIDTLKVSSTNPKRLQRSLEKCFELGEGSTEVFRVMADEQLDLKTQKRFSIKEGCPICGMSWPKLDSRYFSTNSLGKCEKCDGYGATEFNQVEADDEIQDDPTSLEKACVTCYGTGLKKDLESIEILGKNPLQVHLLSLDDLLKYLKATSEVKKNPASQRLLDEVIHLASRIAQSGLGYLQLHRRIRSLSPGEQQRLKLAHILSEQLRGILYVLDEPSQGLHPSEIDRLIHDLYRLRDLGNTVIVVDHDTQLMKAADHIIDLGPGGGRDGGSVVAAFPPNAAPQFADVSLTAAAMLKKQDLIVEPILAASPKYLNIMGPNLHNLKAAKISFLKQGFNVVVGVSGAGKSSLVTGVLFPNLFGLIEKPKHIWQDCQKINGFEDIERLEWIDRRPVAKSSVSMPATYLDLFTEMRRLFSLLPGAQIRGLTEQSFSLARVGGRCEECKGRGEISLSMRFLADARVPCDVCGGKRYRPHILDVTYKGLSLGDVLELTLDEVFQFFRSNRTIANRLAPAIDLGLGYLKLGQSSASLSGGEAQRLRLVPYLVKKYNHGSLVIIDEPTAGLHSTDSERLLSSLRKMVSNGTTLIVIEHSTDLIAAADWIVELGPGAASKGGDLVFEGVLADFKRSKNSKTAPFLNESYSG